MTNNNSTVSEVKPLLSVKAMGQQPALEDDDDPYHNAPLLNLQLGPISAFLNDETVTEIVINEPEWVFVESYSGWSRNNIATVSAGWCANIVRQMASSSNRSANKNECFLFAKLPDGGRVAAVIPPAVANGKISITIRRPSTLVKTFDSFFEDEVFFKDVRHVQSYALSAEERERIENELPDRDKKLLALIRNNELKTFISESIKDYKNIIISGATGSGKTTLANALIECIPPHDRIITAEDTPEMRFPAERNVVNLFYSNTDKSASTPKKAFEATTRMRPDRVLPAELRGDETFFFIQNVLNSGHPGTISTGHANNAKLLFTRLSLLIKTSPEGSGLAREDIMSMLYMLLDVVIQVNKVRIDGDRYVRKCTEIYYDPAFAVKQMG